MKYRVGSSLITPDKSTRVMGKGRTKGWGRGLADRTGTKIQRKSVSSEDGKFGVSGRQELEKIKLLQGTGGFRPQVGPHHLLCILSRDSGSPQPLTTPILPHCPGARPEKAA